MTAIKPILAGYQRQWLRCRKCGRVQYYDYLPYSLSNPIMTTACGHGAAERDLGCDEISADEALAELVNRHEEKISGEAADPKDFEIQLALTELKNAIAFFDRVKTSSSDERIAVGIDHWDWLEKAARKAASFARNEK